MKSGFREIEATELATESGKVEKDSQLERYEQPLTFHEMHGVAQFLYGLLDDIDTASDIAKSDDVLYRKLVEKMQQRKGLVVAKNNGRSIVFKPCDENCKLLIDAAEKLECAPELVGPTLARSDFGEQ